MAASKIGLKLLIDTDNNKLLFAEARKNFVDFLLHILSLPLATVTRLLRQQETIGSLENLYHSIENLDEAYIRPNQNKSILLSPKPPAGAPAFPFTLLALEDSPKPEITHGKAFYKCGNNSGITGFTSATSNACTWHVTDDPRAVCPGCQRTMTSVMTYVVPPQTDGSDEDSKEGGFVKGAATYMIMDDLEVKPMSAISSIALLNELNVKDLSALKEKEVDLSMNKALKLLKASLECKTVLTSVFLDVKSKTP
ncbi:uncharacterized protein [Coffea arabica]|uniref:Uncharacterized protein n=1 Tax=Coffea arabica TaxID=13443 RepID=A0A6P6W6Q7_COFAR|nr:uncharacterized protein LOC113730544 [Coffea arabica]